MNIHENCEYYIKQIDGCLNYYLLGYFNVSQYETCIEDITYEEWLKNDK